MSEPRAARAAARGKGGRKRKRVQAQPAAPTIAEEPDVEELEALPSLRLRLLTIAHMGTSGHRGYDASYGALFARFWWKCMKDDVKCFLKDCLQCAKTQGTRVVPLPWGHQVQPEAPGEVLHFDYLYIEDSGVDESARGESTPANPHYLLVLKDGYSHTVELTPCSHPTAVLAADSILEWISRYGLPTTLISDNGSHFSNMLMDEVTRALSCEHHFTTPLAAWSNGGAEIVNRHVLKVLRTLISENRMQFREWPTLLPALRMVLNHSPSPALGGLAPFTVMTGRKPDHPLDAVYRIRERKGKRTRSGEIPQEAVLVDFPALAVKQTAVLQQKLVEIHKTVRTAKGKKRASNLKAQERRQKELAKKRGIVPHGGYTVGDYVLAARVNPTNKLQCRWLGPMRVVRVLSHWTYRVESLVTGRRFDRHANCLKMYADNSLRVTQSLLSMVKHDDAVYLVKRILEWRYHPELAEVQLLVEWDGLLNTSWEPFATLAEDVPQRVQRFCDQHWKDPGTAALRREAKRCGLNAPRRR